jgi:hypothetical protein
VDAARLPPADGIGKRTLVVEDERVVVARARSLDVTGVTPGDFVDVVEWMVAARRTRQHADPNSSGARRPHFELDAGVLGPRASGENPGEGSL